jgi:hypothetical protein
MRNATIALKQVFIENAHTGHEHNITAVVPRAEMLEIVQGLDFGVYDRTYTKYEGEYFLVISSKIGEEVLFFVESIYRDGELIHDENDIMMIPANLPQEIRAHVINDCAWSKLKSYGSAVTYEDFVTFLEG